MLGSPNLPVGFHCFSGDFMGKRGGAESFFQGNHHYCNYYSQSSHAKCNQSNTYQVNGHRFVRACDINANNVPPSAQSVSLLQFPLLLFYQTIFQKRSGSIPKAHILPVSLDFDCLPLQLLLPLRLSSTLYRLPPLCVCCQCFGGQTLCNWNLIFPNRYESKYGHYVLVDDDCGDCRFEHILVNNFDQIQRGDIHYICLPLLCKLCTHLPQILAEEDHHRRQNYH